MIWKQDFDTKILKWDFLWNGMVR